jgi:hypothetical protein
MAISATAAKIIVGMSIFMLTGCTGGGLTNALRPRMKRMLKMFVRRCCPPQAPRCLRAPL